MKVVLLGTGAARPEANRASPSQAVIVEGEPLLFDCGGGTAMRLMGAKINSTEINNIFFTHLHLDHCIEYPSLILSMYLMGRKEKVNVFGPTGISKLSNLFFGEAFPYARAQIRKLKNIEIIVDVTEKSTGTIYQDKKMKVTTILVDHEAIETVAFRIDSAKGSIVIGGDTKPSENLIKLAKGADILVHECSFPDEGGEKPGHTIPKQLGKIARDANVKKVVLTHLFPECAGKEEEMAESVRSNFKGEVIVGEDLLEISV